MFYLQELLTERKQGIAMIWLLASFGSRSEIYRVRRKEIQTVSVPQACDSLVTMGQDVPFALRLQSTLLLGITRVYSLQANYFFQEVANTSTNLKLQSKAVAAEKTIKTSHHVPRDALVMEDDPSFHPELALRQLIIPGLKLEMTPMPEEYMSMASNFSPQHLGSVEDFPSPNSARYQSRPSVASYRHRSSSIMLPLDPAELPDVPPAQEDDLMVDADFEFNAQGEMIETQSVYSQAPFMSGASISAFSGHTPQPDDRMMDIDVFQFPQEEADDTIVDFRVKEEPGTAVTGLDFDGVQLQGLKWTAPLPGILGNLSQFEYGMPDACDCTVWDNGDVAAGTRAPTGTRPARTRSVLPALDDDIEVRNRDIKAWRTDYKENMKVQAVENDKHRRGKSLVVKELEGLFSIGGRRLGGELRAFGMEQLMGENGIVRREFVEKVQPAIKPVIEKDVARSEETALQGGRAREGSEIESNIGRDDPLTGVVDLSNLGPFAPQDARSRSRSLSGSFGGFSAGSRRGVSPAGSFGSLGRKSRPGSAIRRPGSRSSWRRVFGDDTLGSRAREEEFAMNDTLGNFSGDSLPDMPEDSFRIGAGEEEAIGPFDVDHDREASVFQEYLRIQIHEKNPGSNNIAFDVLLPPESTRGILAANAFYLVLRLASKGKVRPVQSETFGSIDIEMVEEKEKDGKVDKEGDSVMGEAE